MLCIFTKTQEHGIISVTENSKMRHWDIFMLEKGWTQRDKIVWKIMSDTGKTVRMRLPTVSPQARTSRCQMQVSNATLTVCVQWKEHSWAIKRLATEGCRCYQCTWIEKPTGQIQGSKIHYGILNSKLCFWIGKSQAGIQTSILEKHPCIW